MNFTCRFILSLLLLLSIFVNAFLLYQHKGNIKSFKESLFENLKLQEKPKKEVRPFPVENNTPLVYYAFLDNIELVQSSPINKGALEIPGSLIIRPGIYVFYDNVYDLRREGLYRFIYPGQKNHQRIVYAQNVTALLSAIAWIHSHGNSDDKKQLAEINRKALHAKLFMTCGKIASWARKVLESDAVKARIVTTLTLDSWNAYDNGHTMIEVYFENYRKWIVYDLDNNAYFTHDGSPLSLIELVKYIATGGYEVKYLASDIKLDVSNFIDHSTAYDYAFLSEFNLANEKLLRHWYRRVMQVPLIEDGDYYYFFDGANRTRIANYSRKYIYVDEWEFMRKFYH
jgi:hypothetical protein